MLLPDGAPIPADLVFNVPGIPTGVSFRVGPTLVMVPISVEQQEELARDGLLLLRLLGSPRENRRYTALTVAVALEN